MEPIQIIIVLVGLFALFNVFIGIINKRNDIIDSLFWIIFWVTTIIIAVTPTIASDIANLVGIGRGSDLMVYMGVLFLAYMIFKTYQRINKMEQNMTKIIRTIAINKK